MSRSLSQDSRSLALLVLAVAVRGLFHTLTGFTADDAFITFRYAENLSAGLGFVYNEGQRVLGTTSPLFTWLLAVARVLRLDVPVTALVISLLASGATAALLYRMALRLRFSRLAPLPALAYIFWPRSMAAETCGLESALFTALTVAALYFHLRRLDLYAIGVAGLAALTRPEAALLLGLLVFDAVRREPHRRMALLVAPLTVVGPWLLFAWWYFGTPLPHTVTAKLALYRLFGGGTPWERLVLVMGWHHPAGWILTALALWGAWWLYRKQNWGVLALLWVGGLTAAYTLGGSRIFFWYPAPLQPVLLLFAAASVPAFCARFGLRDRWLSTVRTVALAAAILVPAVGNVPAVRYFTRYQHVLEQVHKAIGLYLRKEARPDEVVAAEDIGYMGYYSELRILDRDGLVSPEAVPYNRDGRYLQLILDYRPDFVVAAENSPESPFLQDSLFLAAYRPARRFAADGAVYHVFRKMSQSEVTAPEPPARR